MARHAGYPQECRHFRGIQRKCGAGLHPSSYRDSSQPGPYRWPCLTLLDNTPAITVCNSRDLLTPEEHDEREDRMMQAVREYEAKIARGECPECGKMTHPTRVIGRCLYSDCGHRLGQISLPEDKEP